VDQRDDRTERERYLLNESLATVQPFHVNEPLCLRLAT
jgi:hypothetical protein